MKLTILSSYFPVREQPYRGRTSYQAALELRQWMEVEAVCPLPRYPDWFHPRNFPYSRADLSYSPAGIKTIYLEYPALPGFSRATNGLVCAHYAEPYVAASRPDVLQSYWLYPDGYAAVRVGRKLGIPVVVVAIGSDLNRIPDPLSRHFTRQALSQASYVITMGAHLQQQAVRLGADPKKIRSVINGCDTDVFHYQDRDQCRRELELDPEAPVLLYVGRLDMRKGLGELLQAAASLVGSRPKLRLTYIGEGPAKAILEKSATRAGIAGNVILPGACDSHMIARWLGACDVFTLPSYAEGSPNVIIEALNCGRPVVASEVGGIPELFDSDAGVIVAPRDAAALAHGIEKALQRKWDEIAIAQRYRRSWRALAEEMRSVLMSVAGGDLAECLNPRQSSCAR